MFTLIFASYQRGHVKRVTVNIPLDLHKRLKVHAVMTDTSMNDLVLRGIRLFLDDLPDDSSPSKGTAP